MSQKPRSYCVHFLLALSLFACHSGSGGGGAPTAGAGVAGDLGFSPNAGVAGTSVVLTGLPFSPTLTGNEVKFAGVPATILVATADSLIVQAPVGALTGPITVQIGSELFTSAGAFIALPVVAKLVPEKGPIGGVVKIEGSAFPTGDGETQVSFNGIAAPVQVLTTTEILATVPPGATAGTVTVATLEGLADAPKPFTIVFAPTLASFSPAAAAAGSVVTIDGTNFEPTPAENTVKFNGATVATANVTVVSSTQITAKVPTGATTGKISVKTVAGTAVSATDFQVLFPPTIASFAPASGAVGANVTINGTNFKSPASSNTVTFNGTAATPSAGTATQLTVAVPLGATTGKIAVTTSDGSATSAANFTVPPKIDSFAPTAAPIGSAVTISGSNFKPTIAANTVKFNGTTATVTAASYASLTATVPAGATSGTITVTTADGTATSATSFTVLFPPTVTSFNPASGVVGTVVTVNGINYKSPASANTVSFNGSNATPSAGTATQLTVAVPSGATSGKISVTNADGAGTSAANFTVLPKIDSLTPSSAAVGGSVTIAGSNFASTVAGNTVKFNGIAASVSAASYGSLTVAVPFGATTGSVTVTTVDGSSTSPSSFTVLPKIDAASPGAAAVGASVTISGSNFSATPGSNLVKFNGNPGAVSASSYSSLTVTIPFGATSGPVTVSTPDGTASSGGNFVVLPKIDGASPVPGTVGTSVTIVGSNFQATPAANAVKCNGTSAVVSAASYGSLTVTIPFGATSGPLSVTTADGVATSGFNYTVLPKIDSLSANSGIVADEITIHGSNFAPTTSGNVVNFAFSQAFVIEASYGSLKIAVPMGATTGPISVTTPDGTATTPGNFLVLPHIDGFSPTTLAPGMPVTIRGTNFQPSPGNNTVKFQGVSVVVTAASYTALSVVTPASTTSGKITVTTLDGTATSADNYSFQLTPLILAMTPASAPLGGSVTIDGYNFGPNAASNQVTFFGGAAGEVLSGDPHQIVVKVPSGSKTGPLMVSAPSGDGASASDFLASNPRFLYAANGGDESISCYLVDSATGKLRHNGYYFLDGGEGLQSIAPHPSGKFLFANFNHYTFGSEIVSLRVDPVRGGLSFVNQSPIGIGPIRVRPHPAGNFVYATNATSKQISKYAVDLATGAVTPKSVTPTAGIPLDMVFDPAGHFAYLLDNSPALTVYQFNPVYGDLTQLGTTPIFGLASSLAMDAQGRSLYISAVVASAGKVFAYKIQPDGSLVAIAGSPFAAGSSASGLEVDPTGKNLLVADESGNALRRYAIDASSGALSFAQSIGTGAGPKQLAFDPFGRYVYSANAASHELSLFSADAGSGALTALGRIAARSAPVALALPRSQSDLVWKPRFAFTANLDSDDVSMAAIGAHGALSAVANAPAGNKPRALALSAAGDFLYAANEGDVDDGAALGNSISVFQIASSPAGITAVQQLKLPAGVAGLASIVVDPSDRFVFAAAADTNQLLVYSRNLATGLLLDPPAQLLGAGNTPRSIAVDPAGRYLYSCHLNGNNVLPFRIQPASGHLDFTGFIVPTPGDKPSSFAFEPSGRFAFSGNYADFPGTISSFTLSATDGNLLVQPGPLPQAGLFPKGLAIDPLGRFAFLANSGAGTLSGFAISGTALAPLAGSPFAVSAAPEDVAFDPAGRFLYSVDPAAGLIHGFSVDAVSGALTGLSGSPYAGFSAGGPVAIAISGSVE